MKVAVVADPAADARNRVVGEFSAGIAPRDTFVLYAAAHGYSEAGRFYLIPQDYPGETGLAGLASHAIDQTRLQDWIANRIRRKTPSGPY